MIEIVEKGVEVVVGVKETVGKELDGGKELQMVEEALEMKEDVLLMVAEGL
jgi:hypothetical protein